MRPLAVGIACLAYAVVLGAAFMGWGSAPTPSSLLPFGRGGAPTGAPPAPPSGVTPTRTG